MDGAMLTSVGFLFIWVGLVATWPAWRNALPAFLAVPDYYATLIPLVIGSVASILLVRIWRNRITFPRLGYSKFVARREIPRHWVLRFGLLCFALDFAFLQALKFAHKHGIAETSFTGVHSDPISFAAIVLGTGLALVGVMLGMKRLLAIVLPLIALIYLAPFIHFETSWIVVVAGLTLVLLGMNRLKNFLRNNPIQENPDVQ